jgi:CSLREA domain-containing protein
MTLALRWTALVALIGFAAGAVASPVNAGGGLALTVNSTADAVDANPGDGTCATGTGLCTLRAAIQESITFAGADTITLPAGTYLVTVLGADEDASASGDFDITDDLTLTGAGAAATIIDAGGGDRAFDVGGGATVTLSGVAVQNGASNFGGGIRNGANLTLDDVVVADNLLGSGAGAGIANSNAGTMSLTDSVVRDNNATNGFSGGIQNAGTMTIVNSTIADNFAENEGGGILNAGTLTITGSTLSGNDAGGPGGAIRNNRFLTLINTTISGNTARVGAAISNESNTTIGMTNLTIANNQADSGAGGVANISDGAISVLNTIVTGNAPANCTGGFFTSLGHNMEGTDTCRFDAASDQPDTNALLQALADNGGLTQTHAISPSSPALDAGESDGCPATDQRGVARPQDGDGDGSAVCDIGAYEYQVPQPTPTPTVPGGGLPTATAPGGGVGPTATVGVTGLPSTGGAGTGGGGQAPLAALALGAAAACGVAVALKRRRGI